MQVDVHLWPHGALGDLKVPAGGEVLGRVGVGWLAGLHQTHPLVGRCHQLAAEDTAQVLLVQLEEGDGLVQEVQGREEQVETVLVVGAAVGLLHEGGHLVEHGLTLGRFQAGDVPHGCRVAPTVGDPIPEGRHLHPIDYHPSLCVCVCVCVCVCFVNMRA